jgi:CheY-like chemotaxis protein
VIWNLLSNAVKFTPKRGHVIVSCTIDASRVIVSVRDTGRGIPPEFVEHVFEPFRQMDQSSTRTHAGLGLGLAIARSLVELHGGTIEAVSEGLDRGATFTVTLPVLGVLHEGVAIAGVGPEELPRAAPSLNDLKVVVVDDQADTLELVSTVLVGLGAHVRACDSAREALTTVRTWRPDVLIADIAMPGEDGYSLIRKVRALDETEGGETQAIALTAHAHIDDRLRALAAGFQMHVPKPVEPTELAAIVAGLAGRDVT